MSEKNMYTKHAQNESNTKKINNYLYKNVDH